MPAPKHNLFPPQLLLSFLLMLIINSNVYSQNFYLNGSAIDKGNDLIRLTSSTPPTAGAWQAGSAWNKTKYDLNQPFDMSFNMFFGCESGANGGDGMTFTFQNQNSNALGAGGGFLGLGGITPALSIEFDTYDGSGAGGTNEIADDHIAIDINGDVNSTANIFQGTSGPASVQAIQNNRDVENCAENSNDYYTIRIVWDPTSKTLQLYEEGILTLTYTKDIINDIFAGNADVYWGFTGSTGSASNEQWIAPVGEIIPWECANNSCCTPFTVTPTGSTTLCNNPVTIGLTDSYLSYSWSSGGNGPTEMISSPGTYEVTVLQDQFGVLCPSSATFTINPSGSTADISGETTICNDGSTTPITVTLTGSAPWSLTYTIDGVDQTPVSINASPYTIDGTGPHVYTLSNISDNTGCTGYTNGTYTVNTYAGLPMGHDDTFSAPGTADLSVDNDGGTYEWYDAATGGNLMNTGANYTTGVLTGTTTYYVENAALDPSISKSVGLVNKSAGDGPDINDIDRSGLPHAVLWLDFTPQKDFTLEEITCDIFVVLPWSASNVTVRIVDQTTLATNNYTYTPASALPAGDQSVVVPINQNLIAGKTYRISYEGSASIKGVMYWNLIANYPITKDAEISITQNSAQIHRYPGLFDWKIKWTSPAISCGRTPVTAFAVDPCPVGVISGNDTICDDAVSTATITVTLTGTAPWNFIYAIDGVSQPAVVTNTSPYTFQSSTGAHTYTLTYVGDAAFPACINNYLGSAIISTHPGISITTQPSISGAICPGNSFTVSTVATGYQLTYQWQLNNSDITSANSSFYSKNPSGLSDAGTYQVIITDGCNLQLTSNPATLSFISSPSTGLTVQGDEVCQGSNAKATIVNSETGVQYFAFKGNTLVSGPVAGTGGNIQLPIQASDIFPGDNSIALKAFRCDTVLLSSVTIKVVPTITALNDPTVCNNNKTGIAFVVAPSASGATYTWTASNGATINNNGNPSVTIDFVNSPSTVSVTAYASGSACSNESVQVDILNYLNNDQVTATEDTVCSGGTLTFTVNPKSAEFYTWQIPSGAVITNSNTDSSQVQITFGQNSGNVIVTPHHTCQSNIPALPPLPVTVLTSPVAIASAIIDGKNIILDGTGSSTGALYSYLWTSNDPSAVIETPDQIQSNVSGAKAISDYTLTVKTNNTLSCQDSKTIHVTLNLQVLIPNVFSPNGDGVHDYFMIKNVELFPEAKLEIYNQWGELIYKSNSGYTNPWNGTRNGNQVSIGTYYYVFYHNESNYKDKSGFITVIK